MPVAEATLPALGLSPVSSCPTESVCCAPSPCTGSLGNYVRKTYLDYKQQCH